MKIKILVLLLSVLKNEQIRLKTDYELDSNTIQTNNQSLTSLKLQSGKGVENENISLDFMVDLQEKNTLIANKKNYNWGLDCQTSNSCSKISQQEKQGQYKNNSYTYFDSSMMFRFYSMEQDLENNCKFNLVNNLQQWPIKEQHILGLHPNSQFSTYLRQNFQHSVQILIKHNIQDSNNINRELILNPVIDFKFKKYYNKFTNDQQWQLKSSLDYNNKQVLDVQNYCLMIDQNTLFFAPQNIINNVENQILKQMCKNIYNCTKENADLSKLDNLKFILNDIQVELDHQRYLILDSDNKYKLNAIDIALLHRDYKCIEYNYAIGNLVFEDVSIILMYIKQGGASIGLINNKDYKILTEDKNLKIILLIIGIFFLLTLLGFFLIGRQEKQKMTYEPTDVLIDDKTEKLI